MFFPSDDGIVVGMMSYVYMLRCVDGTLYIGRTEDLRTREKVHNDGRGARYTALRRPVRLVYSESYESSLDAARRELQLKRWTRAKKEALVAGDLESLRRL